MELVKKVRESKQPRLVAARKATLAKEIALLSELAKLEKNKRDLSIGMVFDRQMLTDLGVKGFKEILTKAVVKIEYTKSDGSLRVFENASFSEEVRETFFEDYVKSSNKKTTKKNKDSNIVNLIEIIKSGFITTSLFFKNIKFDRISKVEILYVY